MTVRVILCQVAVVLFVGGMKHVEWATCLPMPLLTMRRLGEGSVTYEHAGVIADSRGCAFDR